MISSTFALAPIADEVEAKAPLLRTAEGWAIELLDGTGSVGSFSTIAVGPDGTVHVIYLDGTNMRLKYATDLGGRWSTSVIDEDGEVGMYASMALDPEGNVHAIYYHNSDPVSLLYTTNSGGTWSKATVQFGMVYETDIAVDGDGNAHISYYDATNKDLMYATNANGSWEAIALDSDGDVGRDSSIALDSDGNAYISYYDVSNSDLKYATNADGAWTVITLLSSNDIGEASSIAVDPDGSAHITCYYATNDDLLYLHMTGLAGSTAIVDSGPLAGEFSSVAIDPDGHPHIVYTDRTDKVLRFASKPDTCWCSVVVDQGSNFGDCSMAFDSMGKAHISYKDSTQNDLKYATDHIWAIEPLDMLGQNREVFDMVLDDKGFVHLAFVDYFPAALVYATNAGGSWTRTMVDEYEVSGAVPQDPSIALDPEGKAHIAYYDSNTSDLKYATNLAGAWSASTILSTDSTGGKPSIAVDSNYKVHISFIRWSGQDLMYITNAAGSWAHSALDTDGNAGYYSSMALDSNGKAHVAYYESVDGDLRYITNAGGTWVKESIDATDNVGQFPSIAIDGHDKVHVGYYDVTNTKLKYATNAGGSWASVNVDLQGDVGSYSSIGMVGYDVAISYYDRTSHALKLARGDISGWTTSTVDSDGDVGKFSRMDTDHNGLAHIVYYDENNTRMKYATDAPWRLQLIDGLFGLNAGMFSSLALDSNGGVHIAYNDSTNTAMRYATNAGGAWVWQMVNGQGSNFISLALDPDDNVHIVYYDQAGKDLRHMTNAEGTWTDEIVDDAGEVGSHCSVDVDGEGIIHISYYDQTNKDLRYANYSAGAWHLRTVDPIGNVGQYTDIAVDHAGLVHISYYDEANTALRYAHTLSKGGDFATVELDSADDVGRFTSIAVDALQGAHISYFDVTNGNLMYAAPDATPFTVDSEGAVGQFSSIALDASGSVFIAYHDAGTDDLKLSVKRQEKWAIYTVDTNLVGMYPSLALDQYGRAHISYYDLAKMDLRFATELAEPSEPLGLLVEEDQGRVDLSWNAPRYDHGFQVSGYRVFRALGTGNMALIATVDDDMNYTDHPAGSGTYRYSVAAVNAVGSGRLSAEGSAVVTVNTVPSAPLDLGAAGGDGEVNLTWSAPAIDGGSPVTNYRVYRGASPGAATLLTTVGNALSFVDTGLTNGLTYYYRVSAVNSIGEGQLSNEAHATPSTVPTAPRNLTYILNAGDIDLSWDAPADSGGSAITHYKIYRGTSSGTVTLLDTIGPTLTYTDQTMVPGVKYYFQVSAANSMGEGPLSNEVVSDPELPAAPYLTAILDGMTVELTWEPTLLLGQPPITGYNIYRGTSSGDLSLLATLGNATTYVDDSVTNGQAYYYKVSAINSAGEGALSNEVSVTTGSVPSAPRNLAAVAGNGTVTLTWSAPSNDGGWPVTGYRVYRGTAAGGEVLVATLGNVLTFEDGGLTNGITYFYRVSAVNAVGEGPLSDGDKATPDANGGGGGDSTMLYLIIAIVAILAAAAVVFFLLKRR